MPIESSASSSATACSRSRGEPAARGSPCCGGTVMSPPTSSPSAAQRVDQRRDLAGRAAALLRLVPEVHLDQHPGAGGAAGDLGAELRPVDRLPARDPRRELHAPCCAGAARGSASARARAPAVLASSSCARFSPTSTTPASTTSCDTCGLDRLRRRDQRDVAGCSARAVAARGDALAHLGDALGDRRLTPAHAVRTTTTAWRPVTPSRRWEKWSGDAGVHTSTSVTSLDAARVRAPPGPRPGRRARACRRRWSPRPRDRGVRPAGRGGRRRTRSAPGCTQGPSTRRAPGPGRSPRERLDRGLDHALLEPGPAGVHDADAHR